MWQLLKIRTKEVLYERYRTEKLLARRATQNISDSDKHRMLEGEFQREMEICIQFANVDSRARSIMFFLLPIVLYFLALFFFSGSHYPWCAIIPFVLCVIPRFCFIC